MQSLSPKCHAQNTDCFWLYSINQLRCDITSTSRIPKYGDISKIRHVAAYGKGENIAFLVYASKTARSNIMKTFFWDMKGEIMQQFMHFGRALKKNYGARYVIPIFQEKKLKWLLWHSLSLGITLKRKINPKLRFNHIPFHRKVSQKNWHYLQIDGCSVFAHSDWCEITLILTDRHYTLYK